MYWLFIRRESRHLFCGRVGRLVVLRHRSPLTLSRRRLVWKFMSKGPYLSIRLSLTSTLKALWVERFMVNISVL